MILAGLSQNFGLETTRIVMLIHGLTKLVTSASVQLSDRSCWLQPSVHFTVVLLVQLHTTEKGVHANMASTGSKNLYYRRLVAESNAKACWICFKPSSCVLINDDQDFFYICPGHLTDTKFATAKDADDVARKLEKKKKDEEIEKEIEAVKKEFAEKMKKKMDRRRQKEFEKEGKKPEDEKKKKKEDDEEEKRLEKEQEDKVKELEKKKEPEKAKVGGDGPRIFELHKNFFQMRQQRKAQAAAAKRQSERLRNPNLFPQVPTDLPKAP